jgi:hypothetical protein
MDAPPADNPWSAEVAAFYYAIEADDDYFQPTVSADRGRLHLEARYQYEATDSGSVWAGYNLAGGGTVAWELTPMAGLIFGDTSGVAPGLKGWLGWRMLELYTEAEYVFDADDSADNYFYAWSELSLAPVDWGRIGIVGQRTRAYDTELDVQRGLLAGVNGERWTVTAYLFNPDQDDTVVVVGATIGF